MALADLYVDGLLQPGELLSSVDEIRVYDAHRTSLEEIIETLAFADQRRRLRKAPEDRSGCQRELIHQAGPAPGGSSAGGGARTPNPSGTGT